MPAIIKLENLNFHYNKGLPTEVWAIKNINLEIQQGDYVAFFGPSGCGKTTMLYLIAGIEACQEGSIKIYDKELSKMSNQELAIYRQVGVGIIFQQFNLIPSLTVAANIELPMSFLGISSSRRHDKAIQLLDRLAIKHLADRYPHQLSGGQQQRVGIARALANDAPLIIADEPLGNLDSENSEKVLDFLKELNEKDKRTIIMVTHEAWSLKDVKKIFYMKDGAIMRTEETSRKTLAKSISQHVYSQLSPGQAEEGVNSEALTSLLFRGYGAQESQRFKTLINERLDGKIDGALFLTLLKLPFKQGGIGLWDKKAGEVSDYIESIVNEEDEVKRIFKELESKPHDPLYEEISQLENWLVGKSASQLNQLQHSQLREIIEDRMRNSISAEQFERTISLPKKKFGLGLTEQMAGKLTEKLELVLANSQK